MLISLTHVLPLTTLPQILIYFSRSHSTAVLHKIQQAITESGNWFNVPNLCDRLDATWWTKCMPSNYGLQKRDQMVLFCLRILVANNNALLFL